jgi:hypothetical protein
MTRWAYGLITIACCLYSVMATSYVLTGHWLPSRVRATDEIRISSTPEDDDLDTRDFRRIQALAETFIDRDPLTAANLLVVGGATVIGDQRRLALLLRRYNQEILRELRLTRQERDESSDEDRDE